MSQDKLFVIGIGGTGMRCLEAFTHLCAIGMFDNQEIEVLTLDTDQLNGNKTKTENLIELYSRIKTSDSGPKGGTPNANTFFSAKLNLHKFWTDYSGSARANYRSISKLAECNPENKLVSDLFLDENSVQEFNLAHGYRAQTHLGSHLMYHAIIESARNLASGSNIAAQDQELEIFMNKLNEAGKLGARVFVFGSIFGGTGASSIPVIPKAFQDFIQIRSGGKSTLDFSKTKFGSTLLTEYFTFKKPDAKQMSTKDDSVIADSSFFPLNSQAALQFYQNDPTVQRTYKTMYHIGWPVESKKMGDEKESNTITGGEKQKNPCHITEMLCACAAYDFFTKSSGFDVEKAEYLYKAIEFKDNTFNLSFNDFVGSENKAGEVFANRLGAFFSLAHIVLTKNGAAYSSNDKAGMRAFITQLEQAKLQLYSSLSNDECTELNDYFKQFAYSVDGEKFYPGWIYQVRSTVAPGTFMFDSKAFTSNTKELKDLDVGALFSDDKNHWPKGGILSNRYDSFVKTLIEVSPEDSQKVNNTKEKFMAHIYNAITKSQNII
ncbi:MAG: hypothetical protein NWR79_05225 [Saprospiraceae bacterium]|nr:hypothetical protein [Saprospiraceae bacterium]